MALSRRLRFEILRRDGHTCIYCGAAAPEVKLTVDHVIPITLGGSDEPENLVTACQPCNSGKASISPDAPIVASVKADALRWRTAMMACATGAQVDREHRDGYRECFRIDWQQWTYTTQDGQKKSIDLPTDWPLTIDRFYEAGLETEDLKDAIDIAMRTGLVKDRFRYFAGICWGQIRDRQEIARTMLDAEDDLKRLVGE